MLDTFLLLHHHFTWKILDRICITTYKYPRIQSDIFECWT